MTDGIEKIMQVIFDEAQREAGRHEKNGERDAAEIRRLYEKEAGISEANILDAAEKEAERIRRRSISGASIESRNIKLSARHDVLEKVLDMAEGELAVLDKNRKKALYEKLISKYSSGSSVTVQLNERDAEEIGSKLKVKGMDISVDERTGSFSGGLIIKENRTETDCTFAAMAENAGKRMEAELADMIFS